MMEPNQVKAQSKELFSKLQKEVESQGLHNDVEILKKTSYVVSKRHQSDWSFEVMHHLLCTGSVEKRAKIEEMYKSLKPPGKGNYLIDFTLKFKAGQGEKFPAISYFSDVLTNKDDIILQHNEGEVLLIDLWATWCAPCQAPMQKNADLLEKNKEKWKGKVRIVAVSLDEKKETVAQKVVEKGWKKIQHLKMNGSDQNHELVKLFEFQGIPFIILVAPSGRVDYVGHPSKLNLEERLIALSEMTSEVYEKKLQEQKSKKQDETANQVKQNLKKEEFNKVKQYLPTEFVPLISNKFNKFKGRFGVILTKEKSFKNGGIASKEYLKPIIDFCIDKREDVETKELLETLRDKYGKEMFLVGIQTVIDQKGTSLAHLKDLSNLLNELNISTFRFSLRRDLVLFLRKNQVTVKQRGEEITQYGEMVPADISQANLQSIRARFRFYGDMLFKSKKNFDIVKKLLAMGPQISLKGTKFHAMPSMYNIGQPNTEVQLGHTQGQVLVIDFFLSKLLPCVEKVHEYVQLIKANSEKWAGKVKFVAACLESPNDKIMNLYSDQKWGDFIEFFCFKQDLRFRDEFMHYRIQQMPHICIVDKFGAIAFNGETKNVNLSETIESLLAATTLTTSDPKKDENSNSVKNQYYSAKQLVKLGSKSPAFEAFSKLNYDPKLIIKVTREKVFNTKGEVVEKIYRKPEIGIGIKKEDAHVVDEFFKGLNKNDFKVDVEFDALENI